MFEFDSILAACCSWDHPWVLPLRFITVPPVPNRFNSSCAAVQIPDSICYHPADRTTEAWVRLMQWICGRFWGSWMRNTLKATKGQMERHGKLPHGLGNLQSPWSEWL